MRRISFLLGVLLVPAGCTKPNPASCVDHFCDDPTLPFCDTDGSLGGQPNTCIAVECTPGEFVACRGDDAITCKSTGDDYNVGPCGALGCDDATGCITETHTCTPGTVQCGDRVLERCSADGVFSSEACDVACMDGPEPHCAYISPKYLPDVCDAPATTGHADIGAINTDLDSQCNGGIVAQSSGPEICIVRSESISVPTGIEAKVVGHRVLALVADSELRVDGTLDISADGNVSGPGGGLQDFGDGGPSDGGGGGGLGTAGAPGGNATGPGGAANGGMAIDFSSTLVGGTGNRADPADLSFRVDGGGGGGGATLIACRGRVLVNGIIDAGGGAGQVGKGAQTGVNFGGGGGGAGGMVVLQGLDILAVGRLYANGGAGANGKGAAGEDGLRGTRPASSFSPTANAGAGGSGASIELEAQAGQSATAMPRPLGHGGGGGGLGVLQLAIPADVAPAGMPAEMSPGFTTHLTLETR